MEKIHELIEKYSETGDGTKVSVLYELLHKQSLYGLNTAILKLRSEYIRYGDLSKASALDELEENL